MNSSAGLHIEIQGVVQGVGFRPFVYSLATKHHLKGWVSNTTSGVVIEVEGPADVLETFAREVVKMAPPLSRIEQVECQPIPPNGHVRFEIRESRTTDGYVLISPDMATCEACLRELLDPKDRRHRYPFINCTHCGPRFTIIEDVPYDRPRTTMASFPMCPSCQAEYDDPSNRRFHAQPNACPVCGPRVWLVSPSAPVQEALNPPAGEPRNSALIETCAERLRQGQILALKGLGGFHLACDATQPDAVKSLRERKGRYGKPLAVMMATLEDVCRHCIVRPEEEEKLTSGARPIVLLEWRKDSTVTAEVAPGNRYLGVMLPYTPLHHLLLRDAGRPLVMTSGNLSEEPIAQNNEEAWARLRNLADGFLFHNRDIYARYDDSVWFFPLPGHGESGRDPGQPIRRSRGYAPFPITLPISCRSVLACGPELKNTFCLTRDRYAFLSQHIGDMENLETLEHFQRSIEVYEKLFRLRPEALVHDLHPDYLSTRYAEERAPRESLRRVAVQHHHAHAVSCMIDRGVTDPVIAVTFDGTGFGLDGQIWGGEWLIAGLSGFRRAAWLQPLPLPGGNAGIRNPGRIALAYLTHLLGEVPSLPFLSALGEMEKKTVCLQVEKELNITLTSSCGRLFDAVAAMAGGRVRVDFEAEAAIEMEMVSRNTLDIYPYGLRSGPAATTWGRAEGLPALRESYEVLLRPWLASVVDDVRSIRSLGEIGSKFHRTLARIVSDVSRLIAQQTGLHKVALGGGCFQNRLFLSMTVEELMRHGLQPLVHRQVPTNDGGIALGQAVIGHFCLD